MLEKHFQLKHYQTTVKQEITAGITTFLTMAYIVFVNPSLLSQAGMDSGAVFVATCLAAAAGCFIMGIYANLPVALAPGMGLNAFFTFTVVIGMGQTWQTALGCVFLSGLLFIVISLCHIREWVINAIPNPLKKAIAAGIGGFLAIIAMKEAGIIVAHPVTLTRIGNLTHYVPAMTFFCFLLIIIFQSFKIWGGTLLAMLIITVISLCTGHSSYTGIIAPPPSLMPTFMQMDLASACSTSMLSVVFAFFFVDLFDTAGTLIGVTGRAGLMTADQKIPNLKKALLADSTATVIGAALGTSNTTSYIESAAGVTAGGRTGLMAVVVGILFLAALFFAPLAHMIPVEATSGVILYVAVLMMYALGDIHWEDIGEAAPAMITILGMPLTYSIADGITLGFISYTLIAACTGKIKTLNVGVWTVTAILLFRLIMVGINFS